MLQVYNRFAHIYHLLSHHLSEADIIILILWMRKHGHWSLHGLPNHTPTVSDWAINSIFEALSTVSSSCLWTQSRAEETDSKQGLRVFSSLKNERLYSIRKEKEWSPTCPRTASLASWDLEKAQTNPIRWARLQRGWASFSVTSSVAFSSVSKILMPPAQETLKLHFLMLFLCGCEVASDSL